VKKLKEAPVDKKMSADERAAVAGGTLQSSTTMLILLEACSSITETCLSSRTLRLDSSIQHSSEQNTASLIQKELELADFLERNIFDCRAVLARRGKHNSNSDKATVPIRQELRVKQQELLDESVRKQQERLLLSRIEMSSMAQEYMFPQQQQESSTHSNTGQQKRNHKSETLLVQQVIQSRDEQVRLALNKIQQLDHVRAQLQEASNESRRVQQENRTLWQQQQQQQVSFNNSEDTSITQVPADEATTAAAIDTETRILKRALQDIIAGSELDWYADKRLRETIMKLET
jgi:hypothetical protein